MTEVLVLVDHVDGKVRKPTYELLTIAKRLGEPSAVFIGAAGEADGAVESVKKYGAEKVYVVDDAEIKGYLVAPKAEVLQQLVEKTSPAAVLIPSSAEGKEIAARLAVKIDSGLITDAVDVSSDDGPVTTQSVFAGNYTVQAKVTKGTPIITVKPNSATPEEGEGAGAKEEFAATISDSAKKAKIVASQAAQGLRAPRADRGRDRGLRWPRHRRRLLRGRGLRRLARCRRRRLARRGRLRLEAARLPDRPDRQDRLAAALRRQRHLRRDPAPRRHADLQDDRRGQQGRGGADLRARRLRRRRRPAHACCPPRPRRSPSARADPANPDTPW